ncbi:GIY-YIG nuclease family protein [Citrobacter freundii]|uniref:GIY-YIG nuclease family protein n=1 Tax=Citrobacter freundii TaxID=546 RepID=UPI000D7440F8|nr:GIY-YIG nuclease family protein [Citrobacter freundii]ELK6404949.1 GIY-YIG nuclease family protein [Citrobacter freundii]ELQ7795374.1 GIY-YIG nuclease family protein [Citrobacter freundii]PXH01915.1 hypothetical protein DMR07_12670 [Citrobacter freundii]
MKEEYLYFTKATSRYTHNSFLKFGYTTNPTQRLKQLRRRNKHFEYSDMVLFKNKVKKDHYKDDEEFIHSDKDNKFYKARLDKQDIPDGYTEHYEYGFIDTLYKQLTSKGYYWYNTTTIY